MAEESSERSGLHPLRLPRSVDAGGRDRRGWREGREILSGSKCGGRANYSFASVEMIILQQYSANSKFY